jgi:predicted transcriptional regulator YheO
LVGKEQININTQRIEKLEKVLEKFMNFEKYLNMEGKELINIDIQRIEKVEKELENFMTLVASEFALINAKITLDIDEKRVTSI